jgi:biotin carboxyl carrier protein
MEFEFKIEDYVKKLFVEFSDGVYTVRHQDSVWNAELKTVSDNLFLLQLGNATHRLYLAESEGKKYLFVKGRQFCLEKCETSRRRSAEVDEHAERASVCPPMPGMVVKIEVHEGDRVKRNQSLAVVEAMKMENELKSPINGKVMKVCASAGDLVDAGKPLIELEAG